jgi:ribonucleoside-diphosphate reductase alpha chain
VVVRPDDTLDTLKSKVRKATILGTLQATQTNFRYLRKIWKQNTEEEALLGVSLTGIMDHDVMSAKDGYEGKSNLEEWLHILKGVAIETNKEWAGKLGINPAAAITCVKPSGTVSQLVDSASGIHPRYSAFYIRRVRNDKKDPLSQLMIDQGVPYEEDAMNPQTYVFSFPMKAPEGSVQRNDMGAIETLELWKLYQDAWTEHKPSITVYYTDDEFMEVGAWIYRNFDDVSGVSLLPHSDHTYKQAPYEEIDEETYLSLLEEMPEVDWSLLGEYEQEDNTTGTSEFACSGGACEIV